MSKTHAYLLAELALFVAMALVLDRLTLFTMPQGGSVSLVMLPIIFFALRQGIKAGLLAGVILGCLQLFFGGYFLNVIQVLLDYVVASGGIGLAGIFAHRLHREKGFHPQLLWLGLACLVAGCGRFLGNFLSGITFYADYAPEGTPVWLYSLGYNLSYLLPSLLITFLVLAVLLRTRPDFFKKR